MRINKLIIKNFRSFGEDATTIQLDNLNAFIGANSAGKTTILHALLKLFGINQKDKQLQRSDFNLPKDIRPEDLTERDLSIEAVITFPEVEEDADLASTIPLFFNQMVVRGPGIAPHLRIRLEANWVKGLTTDGDIEQKLFYIFVAEGQEETEQSKIPVPPQDRSQIQVLYVPAQRDPSAQLKNASGTILNRILKGINWPEDIDNQIKSGMEQVDTLFHELKGVQMVKETLKEQWNSYHRDVRYTQADLLFNGTDLSSILKRIEVQFSPTETTSNYKTDQLGEGLRSVFYLSLVSSLLELEYKAQIHLTEDGESPALDMKAPALTVLAVEEPENHVAPHLLGRIMSNFVRLSKQPNAQVVVTSHSPALVKRMDPEGVRYVRLESSTHCTNVISIELPEDKGEAYKYVKGAVQTYPELYFARLVVLGEGESEQIVLPRILEALGGYNFDLTGITFVPLGGRHVNHLWRLLESLKVPYVTLLDLDRERYGGGGGRVGYVLSELIRNGYDRGRVAGWSNAKTGESGVYSDEEIQGMSDWKNVTVLGNWVKFLRKYNIFFSSPLDLDFMMLSTFSDSYKELADRGPKLPTTPKELAERIQKDIRATLKPAGGDGSTYTEAEKELMTWYNYLFLGRGKPSSHMLALSNIEDSEIQEKCPEPLRALFENIQQKLSSDPYSEFSR